MSKGIILLEGADGTGKTTLAREILKREKDGLYLHGRVWKDVWLHHTVMLRWACREADRRLVVIDRHWLSEQIYGATFRGVPCYEPRSVDRVFQKHGALNVLCVRKDLPRHLEHFRRLKNVRPEKFPSVAEVAGRYYDLAFGNVARGGDTYTDQLTRWGDYARRPDVVKYDLDQWEDKVPQAASWLVDQLRTLRAWNDPATLSFERPNVAGSPLRARFLIVGDRVSNAHPKTLPEWPFYSGTGLNSATWLNDALQRIGFDETRALWTNANHPTDEVTRLLVTYPRLRVIALGKEAVQRLDERKVKVEHELPHPQWARRFQHKQPEIFTEQLRKALS